MNNLTKFTKSVILLNVLKNNTSIGLSRSYLPVNRGIAQKKILSTYLNFQYRV